MSDDEGLTVEKLREAMRKLRNESNPPVFTVIEIHSPQEHEALREWAQFEENPFPTSSFLGIPVIIDDSVPPGVLRFKRDGKIVRDIVIR